MDVIQNATMSLAHSPLYLLPAELMLNVLDRVDVLDLPAFVCAIFSLLRHHGIAPPVSQEEVSAMRRANINPLASPRQQPFSQNCLLGIHSLPAELRVQVNRYLGTGDRVVFAIAIWPIYANDFHRVIQ